MKNLLEKLLPITSLSYWRYTRLRRCALSGAYTSSTVTSTSRLGVNTRSQIIGKIFHSQMEVINGLSGHGQVSAAEFRTAFNLVIDQIAAEVRNDQSLRHFGDIRLWTELSEIYRSLSKMLEKRRKTSGAIPVQIHSEETLYSKDRLLFGQLDAFFVDNEGIDLVDYKSGTITNGDVLKDDYANQLYFYAYLLLENYGIYPRSLTLTSRFLESMRLECSVERSYELAADMRSTLAKYNEAITKSNNISEITNPTSMNCTQCDARPVCPAFWREAAHMEMPQSAHAVIGIQTALLESSRRGSSSLSLEVECGSLRNGQIKVTRIFKERYPGLQDRVGQRLMALNLRLISPENPTVAEATERTIFLPLES